MSNRPRIAVLVLAVAIPGCPSTRSAMPVAESQEGSNYSTPEPSKAPSFTSAPELSDRDLNPPLASNPAPMFDPNAPAVAAGGSSRYSPTRPGSAVVAPPQAYVAPVEVAPAVTYTVQRGDNLWSLAKKNNITVRELAAANNIPADSGLRLGQELVIPGKVNSPVAVSTSASAAREDSNTMYEIKSGDTLAKIARKHGTTVAQLMAFNNLRSDMVRAGDKLAIPDTTTTVGPAAVAVEMAKPSASKASTSDHKHVVASGESLTVIARRYGVKIGDLALANKIGDPSLIRPGQELVIPGVAAQSQPATNATVPAGVARPPTTTTTPVTTPPMRSDDLDAGLDTTLDNVPVISVESVPLSEAEEDAAVQTIKIGGGGSGDSKPPLFR